MSQNFTENMTANIKIEEATREQISEFLPEAIRLAVISYRKFMKSEEDLDEDGNIVTREFVDHHKSAKVAISHIELLIKLAKWRTCLIKVSQVRPKHSI